MTGYFEALPWNIIARTVKWLVSDTQQRYKKDPICSTSTSILYPLLETCHNWRILALKHLCRIYSLMLFHASTGHYHPPLPSAKYHQLGLSFVRTVTIHLDHLAVSNGSALKKLKAQCFPLATQANVRLADSEMDQRVSNNNKNVVEFIAHLSTMFPRLSRIDVEYNGTYGSSTDPALGTLLNGLLSAKSASLSLGYCHDLDAASLVTTSLSRLDAVWNHSSKHVSQLIHRSADTLESLSVKITRDQDLTSLFSPECNKFPLLHTLQLTTTLPYFGRWHKVPGHTQFPQLQHLTIDMDYPFANDFLLRHTRLETLDMHIDPRTIEILHKAISDGQFQKLSRVKIRNLSIDDTSPLVSATDAARLAFAFHTPVVFIQNITSRNMLFSVIENHDLCHLEVLSLHDATFTTANVFAMLRKMPRLTDLHCLISTDEMPNMLAEAQSIVSSRFKYLELGIVSVEDAKTAAQLAMLLAIACPRFTYMGMFPFYKDAYNKFIMDSMRKAMAQGSLFQRLPWKVIDIIVGYTVGPEHQRMCVLSDASARPHDAYRPLMQVCHEWRLAVSRFTFSPAHLVSDTPASEQPACKPPTLRKMGMLTPGMLYRR
ncbi:hypothetical protein GGI25_005121 [Coemansia spiralis]|uniref:Uncharacterized protein n=2 Tax=Coemansia TaxID=4863 RepID=A0A9W8KWE6_9FUNG|nr:hypothetical protein EDC05_005533 [Coemansia umbellata]KAJ2619985.1 hypothetical protein GGI26_005383 [Coemansia sp. RSA 1358]KAJ2672412.1 hypothetical protein GGI25_005121 [Coemansia spiralis]